VTLLNVFGEAPWPLPPGMTYVCGSALGLPFDDNAFDVAYSNSVIEHVRTWENQVRFAAEIRRVAPRYYVQTPNAAFPIEPHVMGLGIQWLPKLGLSGSGCSGW
jgi:hypothetical protein